MSNQFVFTPGQREEVQAWLKENCPKLHSHLEEAFTGHEADMIIDMFYKLKNFNFDLKPEEFVIGIEYKDSDAVIAGTEQINIRMINPHKNKTADQFAQSVLLELLNRLKG